MGVSEWFAVAYLSLSTKTQWIFISVRAPLDLIIAVAPIGPAALQLLPCPAQVPL